MMRIVISFCLLLACQQVSAVNVNLQSLPALLDPFLTGKPAQIKCEEYLKEVNELNGATLLLASAHCTRANNLAEAAFLLNSSNIRLAVELEYFPPSQEEMGAISFLNMVRTFYTSGVGNDKVFRSPLDYARLKSALLSWQPMINEQSSPGWSSVAKQNNFPFAAKIHEVIASAVLDLDKWAQMLQDDLFYRAKSDYEEFNAINPQYIAGSAIGDQHDHLKRLFDKQLMRHICMAAPNTALQGTHYMPLLGIPCAPEL